MARIEGPVEAETILAFKGTLDFYVWRGLWCVRGWPRKPAMPRSPAVQESAATFAAIIKEQGNWSPTFHNAALEQTQGTEWTWRDELVRSLYGNLWYEPHDPRTDPMPYLSRRIFQTFAAGASVINVNSTTYTIPTSALTLVLDFDNFPATYFRLSGLNSSNAAGQTITAQLSLSATPTTPLSPSGNDVSWANAFTFETSGWLPLATPLTGFQRLALALKGSNATVDLDCRFVDVEFRYSP